MRAFGRVLAEEDSLDPGGSGEPLKDAELEGGMLRCVLTDLCGQV